MPAGASRHSRSGTRDRIAAAALACLLAAAGCSGADDPPPLAGTGDPGAGAAVDNGGTVVVGEEVEPGELNCLRVSDTVSVGICRLVCDTLLGYGPNLEIVPRLAESFDTSPDGTSITFHLRPDARWHDGERVTSKDVLYTIRQVRDPGSMIQGNVPAYFEKLVSITAPDDHTVVAVYREPNPLLYQAWSRVFIMPAHLPFAPGATTPQDRAPIGSGPFAFGSWKAGESLVLDAFDRYPLGRPHVDHLVFRFASDAHSRLLALGTGEMDLAGVRPADLEGLPPDRPFDTLRYLTQRVSFILWNIAKPDSLFADARVRKAMSLGVDRQGYIQHVRRGNDVPAVSTIPPGSWAHDPSLEPLPYDPNGAAKLLAEAGFSDRDGDGVLERGDRRAEFTLLILSGQPEQDSFASMMKEQLASVGVVVHIQTFEWKVLLEKVKGGAFDAAVYQWKLDEDPDPYDFFNSSQARSGQNYGGYSNAEVDRLSEEGRSTLDQAKRASLYHAIERILHEEQPYMFISHQGSITGVAKRLRGVKTGVNGIWGWTPGPLSWWIPAGLQRRP